MQSVEEERGCGEKNPMEAEILKLRNRWELASVLNFLDVRISSHLLKLVLIYIIFFFHFPLPIYKLFDSFLLGYEDFLFFILNLRDREFSARTK